MQKISTDISEYFLYPSTLFASKSSYRVQTILGSCVSVCLFDARLGIGGINHFMLPWWNGEGIPSPKYGDVAIELLIEKMMEAGSQKQNMVAKIFGGANQHSYQHRTLGIGERNITTAETVLDQKGIEIITKSVGGKVGRKIIFYTATGQVFMKLLERTEN